MQGIIVMIPMMNLLKEIICVWDNSNYHYQYVPHFGPQSPGLLQNFSRSGDVLKTSTYVSTPSTYVSSSGFHVEQSFHSPGRSYGFGIEHMIVHERSFQPKPDHLPIVVNRPFESQFTVYPLSGQLTFQNHNSANGLTSDRTKQSAHASLLNRLAPSKNYFYPFVWK